MHDFSGMADAGGMGYPPSPLIGPWPRVFGCGAGVVNLPDLTVGEVHFDPEKVPGGAPAPRVELSGSVVTDEARKSLRDVSKTPVPDLSVPGEGPALDPDTQAFLDAHGGHGFAGAEGYVSDWPSAA